MSVGTIDRFDIRDISIKDLVLDDLSGYFDMLNDIDENMLDRQASIVLYEVYKDAPPLEADIPLIVKRWMAAHTVLRLIPALRTYIAKNEKRGDILERSSTVYYDQLDMLTDIQLTVEQRIHELRNQVQNVLTDEYSVGPPMYDRPGVTSSEQCFVSLDPWRIGKKMFENT
jgi:hypothetical protein